MRNFQPPVAGTFAIKEVLRRFQEKEGQRERLDFMNLLKTHAFSG